VAARIINMTVPEQLLRDVDQAAKIEGRTRSELFREAVRRYLQERRPSNKTAAPLLSRLAALSIKGPSLAAADLDKRLYRRRRR